MKSPSAFERALDQLTEGHQEGDFGGRRWGAAIHRSKDGRRVWLFAEELGGREIVSFNLYCTNESGSVLKPCEMSSEKVVEFVLNFRPDDQERERKPVAGRLVAKEKGFGWKRRG